MGAESEMLTILGLKYLVFEAGDTDNDLMIKQVSSHILRHHINRRNDCYPHSLEFCSMILDNTILYTMKMLKKLKKNKMRQ